MDSILSILPESVHIRIGIEEMPTFMNPNPTTEWHDYKIPKKWLKHGERGRYNEWTIKKQYEKKYKQTVGEHTSSFAISAVLEWNQLENISQVLKQTKKIGFDNIMELVPQVDSKDVMYFNQILM